MEIDTEQNTADAVAPEGAVRSEMRDLRRLLAERQRLTDQLAVIQRDIDAHLLRVKQLEGR